MSAPSMSLYEIRLAGWRALTEASAPPAADPNAEAQRINAKVGGWRYKIAGFQYDQMTRRMADLLKAVPPA